MGKLTISIFEGSSTSNDGKVEIQDPGDYYFLKNPIGHIKTYFITENDGNFLVKKWLLK